MKDVPIFPLNTVLFPGGRLPLRIFEQRYMGMAKTCLRDGAPFGVCLIREGKEVGSPATPVDVGCLARIAAWDMPQLGLLHITARGEQRFRIVERHVEPDGLARGTLELMPEDRDGPIPESCVGCVKLLERVIAQQASLFEPPHRLDSASWVSARLAEILPLPLPAKQELLELADARARIERLNALLRPPAERF
jgi:Lon protease-like protein